MAPSVTIQIKRRTGRKRVMLPKQRLPRNEPWNAGWPTSPQQALARSHRWLATLESSEVKFSKALAALEGIAEAYVSRRVNLTAFAPDSVAATLDEALPSHVTSLQLAVDPTASGEVAQGRQLEVVG